MPLRLRRACKCGAGSLRPRRVVKRRRDWLHSNERTIPFGSAAEEGLPEGFGGEPEYGKDDKCGADDECEDGEEKKEARTVE